MPWQPMHMAILLVVRRLGVADDFLRLRAAAAAGACFAAAFFFAFFSCANAPNGERRAEDYAE